MRLGRKKEQDNPQWLAIDATMTGSLSFKDPVFLKINNRFEGALDMKGTLSIGPEALVQATLRVDCAVIEGRVEGSIFASERIEMLAGAQVRGKVVCADLIVHEGAKLQGMIEMEPRQGAEQTRMAIKELAGYLEVDVQTVEQWAQEGRVPAQRDGDQWRFDRSQIEQWLAQERVK